MTCDRIKTDLDDYLDEEMAADARWELEAHVQYCEPCQAVLERARRLQRALGTYPVDGPTPGFFERAIETARDEARPSQPGSSWSGARAGAMAAGIAVLLVGGLLLQSPELMDGDSTADSLAGLSMAMHETRTINLVFASASELLGVSLTVDLPDGVELAGYSGLEQVRWTTHLQPGKNVLPLELVAIGGSGGELVARLQHEGDEKIFTVSVAVI